MGKRKKPRRGPAPRKKPTALEIAERSIAQIAERDHTTPEMVRKQIQVSLINGLISNDPQTRQAIAKIPHRGDIPTPEEISPRQRKSLHTMPAVLAGMETDMGDGTDFRGKNNF